MSLRMIAGEFHPLAQFNATGVFHFSEWGGLHTLRGIFSLAIPVLSLLWGWGVLCLWWVFFGLPGFMGVSCGFFSWGFEVVVWGVFLV